MKGPHHYLLFVLFPISGICQLPVPPENVYSFMKNNSVFLDRVNWTIVDSTFALCLNEAKMISDTMNCFVKVLEALDDVHSQIMFNNQYYSHYHAVDDSIYQRILPLREKAMAQAGIIQTSLLKDQYVYVRVPAMAAYTALEKTRYGEALDDSICQYNPTQIKGFIIDLRLNTGGNMYPMLSGLQTLLGNNLIGFEMDYQGTQVRKWEIANGNLVMEGYQVTDIGDKCEIDYSGIQTVVITGPMTMSSGSMTAIAFKQRPNTWFVGEPTADGYTTSNGYFHFATDLTLNFATHFVADRNKNIYKTFVSPDQVIEGGDQFDDLLMDDKINAAVQWLERDPKP